MVGGGENGTAHRRHSKETNHTIMVGESMIQCDDRINLNLTIDWDKTEIGKTKWKRIMKSTLETGKCFFQPYLNIIIEFKQWNSKKFQIFWHGKVLSFRKVNKVKLLTFLHYQAEGSDGKWKILGKQGGGEAIHSNEKDLCSTQQLSSIPLYSICLP